MRFMLDTNVLSVMLRNPEGDAARRIEDARVGAVCTSIVCAAEMRFGAVKSGSTRMADRVEWLLATFEVLPLSMPADAAYAKLRAHLEKLGRPIGSNDMLIAAHALATDSILVTDNVKEFSRVPGLKIENWLR